MNICSFAKLEGRRGVMLHERERERERERETVWLVSNNDDDNNGMT